MQSSDETGSAAAGDMKLIEGRNDNPEAARAHDRFDARPVRARESTYPRRLHD